MIQVEELDGPRILEKDGNSKSWVVAMLLLTRQDTPDSVQDTGYRIKDPGEGSVIQDPYKIQFSWEGSRILQKVKSYEDNVKVMAHPPGQAW